MGNVTLKASEGLGRFVKQVLTSEFKKGLVNKLGALIAYGAIKRCRAGSILPVTMAPACWG